MGACATKPKIIGEKLRRASRRSSRRNSSLNSNLTAPDSSPTPKAQGSSLKEDKRSLSTLSATPNNDETTIFQKQEEDVDATIISPKEDEDVDETMITQKEDEDFGSKTIVAKHQLDNQEELSSSESSDSLDSHDQSFRFDDSAKDHEADQIVSEVTNAIEEDENVGVDEPTSKEEAGGPSPTRELQEDHIPNKSPTKSIDPDGLRPQSSPPSYTSQSDVIETYNQTEAHEEQNDVVEKDNQAEIQEEQDDVAKPTNLVGVVLQDSESDSDTSSDSDSDSPPPNKNDVVETISTSEGESDVVVVSPTGIAQIPISPPPSYTPENIAIEPISKLEGNETLISASTSNPSGKDLLAVDKDPAADLAELHGPIKTQSPVVYEHVPLVNNLDRDNEEDHVVPTNAIASTYAF